jgi:hypothetical protein
MGPSHVPHQWLAPHRLLTYAFLRFLNKTVATAIVPNMNYYGFLSRRCFPRKQHRKRTIMVPHAEKSTEGSIHGMSTVILMKSVWAEIALSFTVFQNP